MKAHVLAAVLLWSPAPEPDFSHYIVFAGESIYTSYYTTTDTTFSPLQAGHWYAVKAVDLAGNVSGFSNEVQYQEVAMDSAVTLTVKDSLTYVLHFRYAGADTSLVELEHRFFTDGYFGNWRLLLAANDDFKYVKSMFAHELKLVINVEKLRSFLNPETIYFFRLRARYDNGVWIEHPSWLVKFSKIENELLSIHPRTF